jgi:hypothetical protein
MSRHPDDERISRNLFATEDEFDQFELVLRGLRGAVHQWSDAEYATVVPGRPRLLRRPLVTSVWSVVFLLAFMFACPPLKPRPVVTADIDAELMDEVRADLARPVPRDMESLLP